MHSKTPFEEVWSDTFGNKLPPIIVEFLGPRPNIVFTHYEPVKEIIGPLNKYLDREQKYARVFKGILGESIVLSKSNELTFQNRKRVSTAFYKHKINLMLKRIIELTCERVYYWRNNYSNNNRIVDIMQEILYLTNSNIQDAIFGPEDTKKIFRYVENGTIKEGKFSDYTRESARKAFDRGLNPLRIFFDVFDNMDLNKQEREERINWTNLRQFMLDIVRQRKKEMNDNKEFVSNNFISILLEDEFYSQNEEYIVDEINAFIVTGTLTTALSISNTLYYLTKHSSYHQDIISEVKKVLGRERFDNTTAQDWKLMLDVDKIDELKTLQNCISETLRISPSARGTLPMCFKENVSICGKNIRAGDQIQIMLQILMNNEDEWQQPDRFIPERFDPLSKYYLTPCGKKRNTASYIPFFGGKRVCLGKTFAESASKALLPIILSQIELEFADEQLNDKKPMTHPAFDLNPQILVIMKTLQ